MFQGKTRWFLLVVVLILSALSVFVMAVALSDGSTEDDPVIIRVGEITYTRSQIHSSIQTDVNLSQLITGTYLTDAERLEQQQATIDRYVGAALIEVKLTEAGKNDFTVEEEETLKEYARNQYEQIWQGIWQKAKDSGEEFTEEQVTEFLEDSGYTIAAIVEEAKAYERRLRAIALYCLGMILTEDMVQEYYEENFLIPDRERYENNIDRYEEEVLALKNESFYVPEGYRAIKQILLDYPEEVERALKNERARCNVDANAVSSALEKLMVAVTAAESWDDIAALKKDYDEAVAELNAALEDYRTKRQAMTAPLIQDTVEEIQEEYRAGIDIDTMIQKYSKDTNEQNTTGGGYPFHPDSKNWTEEFSTAAAALQKPGDLSQPIYSDLGIHILYYASDIPGGEHVLTDQEQEILNTSAKEYYEGLELDKLIETWKDDYEIEIHPELLED